MTELTANATRCWTLFLAAQTLSNTPVAKNAVLMMALLPLLHGVRWVLLLPLQDALAEDPNESPYRVRSVLKVQVSLAAVELQGAGGTLLMQASMCGVDSKAVLYPKTQDIAFSVSTVRYPS